MGYLDLYDIMYEVDEIIEDANQTVLSIYCFMVLIVIGIATSTLIN